MLNRLMIAGLALVCAAGAYAQPGSSSSNRSANASGGRAPAAGSRTSVVPQVVEAPAATESDATGMFGGNKPFSLIVDEENGELEFKFSDTNELERLVAKTGVILSSEEMTLNADRLDYDTISSRLVASGQRVIVRQGDIIATCQLFNYDPNTQASELRGNPVIYNQDPKNGQVSTTRGREIDIFSVDGKPQFRVRGGGKLNTGGAPAPNPAGGRGAGGSGSMNMGALMGGQGAAPAARPAAPVSNRIDTANLPTDMRSSAATSAR